MAKKAKKPAGKKAKARKPAGKKPAKKKVAAKKKTSTVRAAKKSARAFVKAAGKKATAARKSGKKMVSRAIKAIADIAAPIIPGGETKSKRQDQGGEFFAAGCSEDHRPQTHSPPVCSIANSK
jgi:hypothetical protein